MPIDSPRNAPSTLPRRPWYATDSARAGLVLTIVTVVVLAVGVLVINSARRSDPTAATTPGQELGTVLPIEPAQKPENWIVLEGREPEPSALPQPEREPVQTADRFGSTPPERR